VPEHGAKKKRSSFGILRLYAAEGVFMKFFIDTANIDEIKKAWELGVIDGVTTNPSLIAKEGKDPVQILKTICSIVKGPVNGEVVGITADEMLREARALAGIHKNIVVKIPMIEEGLKAVRKLSSMGIKTNVTLIFSANQALLAAKAGATYVSPFVGRLDDISHQGMDVVADIMEIYENYLFETEVIVASVRNPLHVLEAARMGAHIATIPYAVISQLAKHPLTDAGLAKFLKDWENVPKKTQQKK
jgi:transaldolase